MAQGGYDAFGSQMDIYQMGREIRNVVKPICKKCLCLLPMSPSNEWELVCLSGRRNFPEKAQND